MKNKMVTFVILVFVFCSTLFAAQKRNRVEIEGLRPMSMGGAFNAISDDENAFFYNPSGITQREGWLLQIVSADVAIKSDIISTFGDFSQLFDDGFTADKIGGILERMSLKDKIGILERILPTKLGGFFSGPNILFITSPIPVKENYLSFGLGFFGRVDGNLEIKQNNVFSYTLLASAKATDIQTLPVAFKISSLDAVKMPGSLSLGMNLKRMGTTTIEKEYSYNINDNELNESTVWLQGESFGIDIGMIYHLNPSWNFGLSVTDIYNTGINYKKLDKEDLKLFGKTCFGVPHIGTRGLNCREEKIDTEVNIGTSWYPKKFYYWPDKDKYLDTNDRLALAVDLNDLTNLVNHDESFFSTFFKNIHMGLEYKYNPFVVRAGFNSGYPTFGFGLGSDKVQLEYAFYGEEREIRLDPTYFHRLKLSVKLGNNKGKRYGKS